MKIQPAACCSIAYGSHARSGRIILLIAAALLLVAGIVAERRETRAGVPVVRESIVVQAESPRAVVTKLAATYSVQVSDMRDQLSVFVTDREGSSVSPQQLDARASYTPRGGAATAIALTPMNDHLMAAIDPLRRGTFTVAFAKDGVRQQITFDLPIATP